MGLVYEAEDTRLKRRVALKVLSDRVAGNPNLKERFQREAESLATLNHPNIVTVFSVELDGEVPFLTMELVEGRPLNALIPAQGMDLDSFLNLALPLAEALSTAHEMKIIHRDLKPANILVDQQGRPKILDFGLAKFTEEADTTDQTVAMSNPLTEAGSIVGTAPYMSPEQLESKPVDARSDIFSLGIIMYEMLTGERPFQGDSSMAVMSAVLKDTPRRVTELKSELPPHLDLIVSGCLEKKVDDRPQSAKGVRNNLRSLQRDLSSESVLESAFRAKPPARGKPAWIMPVLVAAAIGIAGGGAWWLMNRGETAAPAQEQAQVAAPQDQRKMIAVLPFENLGDSQDEYFADGLTEEITSRLAGINGLGVISRTSAMQYKGKAVSLQEVGHELGVEYVLEGTVRWQKNGDAPSRIRVTPQLIRVADDTHLWSSRYDGLLEEIFSVQSDIAEKVAGELNITLLAPEKEALALRPTENMEAYQTFLLGKEIWNQPGYNSSNFRRAISLFQQALDLDPDFLEAWTELSSAYLMLYVGGDGNRETLELGAQALARAEALAPDSPLVIVARGYFHYLGHFDYERALAEFRRAEKLVPNDPMVPEGMAYILRRMGKLEEALEQLRRALLLDPNNAHLHLHLAHTLNARDQYALAEASYDRSIALFPDGTEAYLSKAKNAFDWRGSPEEALSILGQVDHLASPQVAESKVRFLMYLRQYDDAAELLASYSPANNQNRLALMRNYVSQMNLALARDDRQAALAAAQAGRALTLSIISDQPRQAVPFTNVATFEAVLGERQAALDHLQTAMELGQTDHFYFCGAIAWAPAVYLLLGEKDEALDLLAATQDNGCFWDIHRNDLKLDPRWDSLRDDPRFQALIKSKNPG
jgi:non-specific serine/threonine protein kinase